MHQIGDDKVGPALPRFSQVLSRQLRHIAREIDAHDLSCAQVLQQQRRQFAGPASRVKDGFIPAQMQFPEHTLSPLKLRFTEPMICNRVPLARSQVINSPNTALRTMLKENDFARPVDRELQLSPKP